MMSSCFSDFMQYIVTNVHVLAQTLLGAFVI